MKKILSFILSIFCVHSFLNADEKVESLKRQVCEVLPSLEGWCSKEKALHFIDLVLEVKPEVYVEIGVFGGSSVFPVASALKFLDHGTIIGIDPWDKLECIKYFDPIDDSANLQWWGKINLFYIYFTYLNMVRNYGLEKYVKTLKMTSEKAASEIDAIDILYIDGNHSETVSTQDVQLYLPKVRSGGYIWMNDALWTTTQEAVSLLTDACEIVKTIDKENCILFRKR